jgi:UDP-N-acetylmuramate--alanine ligase
MMLTQIDKIHFVGIGGIGVSAVAKLMAKIGKTVTGSDATESEITHDAEKAGIKVSIGHKAGNLPKSLDLVVYSGAVPEDNPERAKARERKIPEMTYFEFLGEMSRDKFTIAVSGTHGKSTTTALLGQMLALGDLDPTVIVGSKTKAFDNGNLRHGRTKYFVVEACEHEAHMLNLRPKVIVLTNIEEDHLDFYSGIEEIKETFLKYIKLLPDGGLLIANGDDQIIRNIIELSGINKFGARPNVKVITYGIENNSDVRAINLRVTDIPSETGDRKMERFQRFEIARGLDSLGEFVLKIPGKFNVYNSLAALSCALYFGVPLYKIKSMLKEFDGIWRRFEKLGEKNGAIFISDYGHHPTAVRETLKAAKDFYPGKRIILAFQPHQKRRTQKLFNEFVECFDDADVLILNEIYNVEGREDSNEKISSIDLIEKIRERNKKRTVPQEIYYGENLEETKKMILDKAKQGDVVIIMGAGDIYNITKEIIK